MKNLISILIITCLSSLIFSQNTNISGIINTYSSVSNIQSDTITVSSTNGLIANDLLLIIQMQGATIDETNTNNFGDIVSYNEAGNYEYVRICQVLNTTQIITTHIQRTYSPAGKVQIITVPEYIDATVISTLTANPWDGQTGGVLVFECIGTLTLNSDLNLQGLGFRGGAVNTSSYSCSWLVNVDDYYYDISGGEGAEKGEGISEYISGKTAGRGKQANGGGGGNDHNSGGGGGSNGGYAGNGGERISSSTFTCSGPNTGIGGYVLSYTTNKVFLGGGGGAGHENNVNTGTAGMNGGGIVIIRANTIMGNSNDINVSGETHLINAEDGAGGGGGGGAIVLDIPMYPNNVNLYVNGSDGGSVANVGSSNCNGPGGGGSGGVFLYSNISLPINTSLYKLGGIAGTTINASQSNCSVGGNNNAANGNSGIFSGGLVFFEPIHNIITSQNSITICATDSALIQNNWQNLPGIYYDTIIGDCADSVMETTLDWFPNATSTVNESICFGDSLIINGIVYNSTVNGAIANFVAGSQNGCDSIVTINIEVLDEVTGIDVQTSCEALNWIDGNTYSTNNNTASFIIENGAISGCDSTVFLDYTLLEVDTSLAHSGYFLNAITSSATYQWFDCENGYIPITGETSQYFYPTENGYYAVEVTENGCVDTSYCAEVVSLNIANFNALNKVNVFPNPTNGLINIDLDGLENVSIKIVSIENKLMHEQENINSEFLKLDLNLSPGIYIVELKTRTSSKNLKLIVVQK